MFSKVLIANRGEIAVRIIKTCRRLGIGTVAVYSDADRESVHVKLADESVRVGEAQPLQSYLSITNICDAVKKSGAEAVHPGYGFLSEFHQFAEAVVKAGAVWVGPRPEVMSKIESKTYARRIAKANGIPTIPGQYEPIREAKELDHLLEEGPVLIKPDAGGGGKGTRKVNSIEQAGEALQAASREARLYFGNGDVYAEKLLDRPRHVEVQILGDNSANILHLFERECSLQRRFQKIVEEAPSTCLSGEQRESLFHTAVSMARAVEYTNAGTFEFLYEESSGEFFFLEINKRLQVEHPVTEMTTGIDIVEQQLRVADQQELPIDQKSVTQKGNSIEARIYAEDPRSFIPSPGTISKLNLPEGQDIRVDHALEVGTVVPFHYDPLIAKVITRGTDRNGAISTMREALAAFEVKGIKTTVPFHKILFASKDFVDARFDTTYLEAHMSQLRGEIGE